MSLFGSYIGFARVLPLKMGRAAKSSFAFLGATDPESLNHFSWFRNLLKAGLRDEDRASSKIIQELEKKELVESSCPGFLNLAAAYKNRSVLSYLLDERNFDPERVYRYCPTVGFESPVLGPASDPCLYWNFGDHVGETPLLTATRASQNIEIMRLLLKSGANPNAPSTLSVEESHRVNIFPMHFAAISENIELVKLLLDYGAGLNLKNKAGHGPLFYVCQRGDVGMMRFLLKYGANPALSSPEGISPLDLILKNRMLLKAYEDHRPEGGYFLG